MVEPMADILSTRLHLIQFMSTGHHPDLPTDHDPVVLLSISCALMFSFRFPPLVLLLVPDERAVLLAVVPVGETRRGGEKWFFILFYFSIQRALSLFSNSTPRSWTKPP